MKGRNYPNNSITVLGAGSWGTALAIQFARAEQVTTLWGRPEDQPDVLRRDRRNERYLPGIDFPESLMIEADLETAVGLAPDILLGVPSHVLRTMLEQIKPYLRDTHRIAWATKGFEMKSGLLPHQVANDVLGTDYPLAVLSGPTFAREVGMGLPTAMTVASTDPAFADELAHRITNDQFRA
jgi:glycerol-3-phosphate dehydrogenase (NAD(P)+)